MIKKKYGASILAVVMVLPGGITSFASSSDYTVEIDNKNAESHVHIVIEKKEVTPGPTDPILPVDPDDGGETGEEGGTENIGLLRIDWVTPFEFGIHELSNKAETYTLKDYKENPFVQVSDFRGTGEGWALQVEGTNFINDEGRTLKGAELSFSAGNVQSIEGNQSGIPIPHDVVVSDNLSKVMAASEGGGMVTWANELDKSEVKLFVPLGQYAGDYQATLTWTLTDAVE